MNDMIQWLEEKIDEYKRDAEYSSNKAIEASSQEGWSRSQYITRYAVYTVVYRDLERKLWELMALQECQTIK